MTNPEKKLPPNKPGKQKNRNYASGRRHGIPSPAIDWDEIKACWITTHLSQNDIARKFGVSSQTVSIHAKKGDWQGERIKLRKRAMKRVVSKQVDKTAKEWSRHIKSYQKLDKQIAKILKKHEDNDKMMDPKDIKILADSLTETLKGQKLIKGESTGDEIKLTIPMQVLQFVQEREKEVEQQIAQDAIDVDGTVG